MAKSFRRSRNPVTDLLALNWLGNDQHGASVLMTAQQLLAAEEIVRRCLPPALATSCRVARLERQRLTLAVPAAAHASKLRQLLPRVLKELSDAGWNLNEITVRVQAALDEPWTHLSAREVQPLDAAAVQAFSDLNATLRPGPLADAVSRLVRRHTA